MEVVPKKKRKRSLNMHNVGVGSTPTSSPLSEIANASRNETLRAKNFRQIIRNIPAKFPWAKHLRSADQEMLGSNPRVRG